MNFAKGWIHFSESIASHDVSLLVSFVKFPDLRMLKCLLRNDGSAAEQSEFRVTCLLLVFSIEIPLGFDQ